MNDGWAELRVLPEAAPYPRPCQRHSIQEIRRVTSTLTYTAGRLQIVDSTNTFERAI